MVFKGAVLSQRYLTILSREPKAELPGFIIGPRLIVSSLRRCYTPSRPLPVENQRNRFEQGQRGEARRPATILRWSNRTLILLGSAVGASTYVIGVNQGFNQGKKQGILESQLSNGSPSATGSPLTVVPAAVTTPS